MDELYERQKKVNEEILLKASEDAAFREKLLSDPEAALTESGLITQIEEIEAAMEAEAEVAANCVTQFQACGYWSSRYYCPGKGKWKFGPWVSTQ